MLFDWGKQQEIIAMLTLQNKNTLKSKWGKRCLCLDHPVLKLLVANFWQLFFRHRCSMQLTLTATPPQVCQRTLKVDPIKGITMHLKREYFFKQGKQTSGVHCFKGAMPTRNCKFALNWYCPLFESKGESLLLSLLQIISKTYLS